MDATGAQVGGPARPASAMRAIGLITAIAVAAMVLVVLAPRLVARDGDGDTAGELPTSLAGGQPFAPLPPEVEAAVDGPVFGTQRTNAFPQGVDAAQCAESIFGLGEGNIGLHAAFTTPEGTWLAVRPPVSAPEQDIAAGGDQAGLCLAEAQDDGTWALNPNYADTVSPNSSGWSCCVDGRGHATAGRHVPPEAGWALLDLGSHHLAFEVSGMTWVPFAWTYPDGFFSDDPPAAEVTWVSAVGDVVGQERL